MKYFKVFLLATLLACSSVAQEQQEDDGQYYPEKYEKPYERYELYDEVSNIQPEDQRQQLVQQASQPVPYNLPAPVHAYHQPAHLVPYRHPVPLIGYQHQPFPVHTYLQSPPVYAYQQHPQSLPVYHSQSQAVPAVKAYQQPFPFPVQPVKPAAVLKTQPVAPPAVPTEEPQAKPVPGEQPQPEATPVSEEQPQPEATPVPEEQPQPEATPVPEEQPQPDATQVPEEQPQPEATPVQEEQPQPEATPVQEEQPQPEAPPVPGEKPQPQATPVQYAKPLPLFTPQLNSYQVQQHLYPPHAVAPQSVVTPSLQHFDSFPPHLQYVALLKQHKSQLYNPQPQFPYHAHPHNIPVAAKSSYQ